MAIVYVETTIPSYLTARLSRDLVIAGHQQVTQEWWGRAASRFQLVVSDAVLQEIRAGDPAAAAKRIQAIEGLTVLGTTATIHELAAIYAAKLSLPDRAAGDLLHLAFAVAYEVDYLATWNCAHIANGQVIRQLIRVNESISRPTPIIVTPEELLESDD
jgi:predicted nucleic acid-binding protein